MASLLIRKPQGGCTSATLFLRFIISGVKSLGKGEFRTKGMCLTISARLFGRQEGCYQRELVSDKDYLCHCWISASRAAQVSYLTVISLIWGAEDRRNENEERKQ